MLILLVGVLPAGKGNPIEWSMMFSGGLFILFGCYLVYYYSKIFLVLTLSNEGIRFSNWFHNSFIAWNQIKQINLTGKRASFGVLDEAVSLLQKDGQERVIFVRYYQNMPRIQTALKMIHQQIRQRKLIDLSLVQKTEMNKQEQITDFSSFKKYSGNPLFSYNGLFVFAMLGFLLYNIVDLGFAERQTWIIAFMALCIYVFFGFQLHYFYLNKEYLVIKNHAFPFRKIQFRLKDIEEVVFEEPYQRSTALRVITKDFQSKLFSGGSLNSRKWKTLMLGLRRNKVKIRKGI